MIKKKECHSGEEAVELLNYLKAVAYTKEGLDLKDVFVSIVPNIDKSYTIFYDDLDYK